MKTFILSFLLFILTFSGIGFCFSLTPELREEIVMKRTAVEMAEKKAGKDRPVSDPFVYFDLAMTYAYANKIEEGWELLKKVHDTDKSYAPKMVKKYMEQVSKDPKNWKDKMRLSFALFFDSQKEKALQALQEIETLYPKNIWAIAYQALIHGEMNHVDKAIILSKKALKIDHEVSSVHYLLGTAYLKKGWQLKGYAEIAEALKLKALGH